MDLTIREFTTQIVNVINSSALPMEVKRLVLKDIYDKVEKSANEVVTKAIQERNERIKNEHESIKEGEAE